MKVETNGGEKSFGEVVKELRQAKDWTVKELIKRLKSKGQERVSPAYITRIEQYREIPSPEFICQLADALDSSTENLLELAKKTKIKRFDETLQEKYRKAVGLHRKQRGGR